ncbi:MAG: hypothetical protein FE045_01875 [Thermoplasmata archaeon]|nr:MAG: hypothetical protein FE045_01875 [Thermoplasmata archaeon]
MKGKNILVGVVIVSLLLPILPNNAADTTPPQIKNVKATPNPAVQGEFVTIECVVTDDVAVNVVKVFIKYPDNSTANLTMTKSSNGKYRIKQFFDVVGTYVYHIWANDTSGNANKTANKTFVVQQDDYPPQTSYSLSGEKGENNWYLGDVKVSLCSYDKGMGVKCTYYKLDESPWLEYHTSFNVIGEGIHDLYFYAEDNVGNKEDVNHIQIKIDETKPSTQCQLSGYKGSDGWYITNVTVTLVATDATSGINKTFYKINNGTWHEYTGSFDITEDGVYTLYYYSTDKAGNEEEQKTKTIKIDKAKPTVTITKPKMGYLYIEDREIMPTVLGNTIIIGKITIYVDASNHESGISKVEFYIDNILQESVTQQPYAWQWNYLAIGTHLIKVIAYDNAGNYASDEIVVKIFNI